MCRVKNDLSLPGMGLPGGVPLHRANKTTGLPLPAALHRNIDNRPLVQSLGETLAIWRCGLTQAIWNVSDSLVGMAVGAGLASAVGDTQGREQNTSKQLILK
jgi:hypothetical protein